MWERYPEIQRELEALEVYIETNTVSKNTLLSETVRHLLKSGGKRLRPALTIISANFGEYERDKILPLAGGVEVLHTATLVHDDIIDKSCIRRGKPTVSEKYGTDMAVYTGDYLFTRAVLMLSGSKARDKLDIIARAVKTICEGEVDQYREKYDPDISVMSYLKRISKKTAVLFGASCVIGAQEAGCGEELSKALGRFGYCYGMAFQIRDDLMDFLSDTSGSGKPVGRDLMGGIITLPVIYAISRKDEVKKLLRDYSGGYGSISAGTIRMVYGMVRESGGVEASGKLLARYAGRSVRSIAKLPDNEYKDVLLKLAGDLIEQFFS